MRVTRIYISGKVEDSSADFGFNLSEFKERMRQLNIRVINPEEKTFSKMRWSNNIQHRLDELAKCQAIFLLPNWREHTVSRIELTAAMDQGLEMLFHPMKPDEITELLTTLDV